MKKNKRIPQPPAPPPDRIIKEGGRLEPPPIPPLSEIEKNCETCLANRGGECLFPSFCTAFSAWKPKDTPTSTQVAGDHYKGFAIQPVEFITKNNLGFIEGNVIKYVCRHKAKNGAEDIKKAIHYCQLMLELQYGEK